MIRYCKQRENATCGPVAVLNTLKWLGYKVNYSIVKKLCKHKGFHVWSGIDYGPFGKMLKTYIPAKIKMDKKPTLSKIRKHLKSGGAVIISYAAWGLFGGHYALITDISYSGKIYHVANMSSDRSLSTANEKMIKWMLRKMLSYPRVWYITKVEWT